MLAGFFHVDRSLIPAKKKVDFRKPSTTKKVITVKNNSNTTFLKSLFITLGSIN
jgi:hypothetical protein